MDRTIVGIDVGTTKVCTLIAELDEADRLCVVGVGVAPSQGLSKGVIVNVDDASKSIAASIRRAERMCGYTVESAYVSLGGKQISSLNSRGVVAVGRGERYIVEEDVARAIEAAQAIAVTHNREIVHVIPRTFILDGQEGVRDPVGMMGFRLEVEVHLVTGATASIQNLRQCIRSVNIEINELVAQPLASSEAVLTPEEKETGVVLMDSGGGTTDVAIFVEGGIWHTSVLPVGGANLTNDIAFGLRTPVATAEELKLAHGHAMPECVGEDETVDVNAFGDAATQSVGRRHLAEIIEARAEEIYVLVTGEVKRAGYEGLLPAGLVLTGGTAELKGFKDLGSEMLQVPVRVGRAWNLGGLAEAVAGPAYATSVGLLLWGARNSLDPRPQPSAGRWSKLYRRFGDMFGALLPH